MKKLSAALVAAALVVAACGGDDDDGATDTTAAAGGDDGATETTAAAGGDDGATETTAAAGGDDGATDEEVCTEERKGGELTLSSRGMSRALDSAISTMSSTQTGSEGLPFYSVLVRFDMDSGEYVPHVAESITPNDDYTEWTVQLRDGVVFGNGDPLDAAALLAHLERHLGEASTSRIKFGALGVVQSWEAIDDMSVKITLYFGWAQFPALLSTDLGMVQNVALIQERGEAFGLNPEGAGVGPYEIVEYASPERIVFEAKDDWWGGPVCIEQLTYVFIPDIGANYDAFATGEIDSALIARDPVLIAQAQSENETRSSMFNTAFITMPNVAAGPGADVRVRQAMAYAIDPEVVNARAWGGAGWGGKGLINPGTTSLKPTEGLPYDPDKAMQLLEEYKAETGWDGTISGVAADTPASNQEAAIAIAAMLDAVGFKVETNLLPINELISQVIIDKNFELVLSWGIINDESALYSGYRGWESTNPTNQNGFASEAYDAALVELRTADTPESYQAALESLQEAVNQDVPFIAYGGDLSTMLFNPAVKGGIPYQNQTYLLDHAYIEQ